MKIELLSLSLCELETLMLNMEEPKFRAKQIYGWLNKGVESFEEMKNIPEKLRQKLSQQTCIGAVRIEERYISKIDGTRKYLLELRDGNFIESVLMKYEYGYTVCISSQVGCRMGCRFCASTIGGKERGQPL